MYDSIDGWWGVSRRNLVGGVSRSVFDLGGEWDSGLIRFGWGVDGKWLEARRRRVPVWGHRECGGGPAEATGAGA